MVKATCIELDYHRPENFCVEIISHKHFLWLHTICSIFNYVLVLKFGELPCPIDKRMSLRCCVLSGGAPTLHSSHINIFICEDFLHTQCEAKHNGDV